MSAPLPSATAKRSGGLFAKHRSKKSVATPSTLASASFNNVTSSNDGNEHNSPFGDVSTAGWMIEEEDEIDRNNKLAVSNGILGRVSEWTESNTVNSEVNVDGTSSADSSNVGNTSSSSSGAAVPGHRWKVVESAPKDIVIPSMTKSAPEVHVEPRGPPKFTVSSKSQSAFNAASSLDNALRSVEEVAGVVSKIVDTLLLPAGASADAIKSFQELEFDDDSLKSAAFKEIILGFPRATTVALQMRFSRFFDAVMKEADKAYFISALKTVMENSANGWSDEQLTNVAKVIDSCFYGPNSKFKEFAPVSHIHPSVAKFMNAKGLDVAAAGSALEISTTSVPEVVAPAPAPFPAPSPVDDGDDFTLVEDDKKKKKKKKNVVLDDD